MCFNFSFYQSEYIVLFFSDPSVDDTFEMKANTIKGSKKMKKIREPKQKDEEPESTDTDDISTDEEVEEEIAKEEIAQSDLDKTKVEDNLKSISTADITEKTQMVGYLLYFQNNSIYPIYLYDEAPVAQSVERLTVNLTAPARLWFDPQSERIFLCFLSTQH